MADRLKNIKSLFANSRTRVIILCTVSILLLAVIIGLYKLGTKTMFDHGDSSLRSGATGISSIPGSLHQTAQYAALQEQQNIDEANIATKNGASAIPTIIRAQAFGNGIESVGAKNGSGSVGFVTLARDINNGPSNTLWFQSLKAANCSKESAMLALKQGAALVDLINVCSCEQLYSYGYTINELKINCSCEAFKKIGINAAQLKTAGFDAQQLKICGFTACQERAAGFSAADMKKAGYSDGELKGSGFSDQAIAQAGGLPPGVTAADIRNAGCGVAALTQLRAQGVSAAAIRRISGCSAAQLKAAGFSAADLKNAGFSAAQLKNAGFTPAQLASAGFTPKQLLAAGLSPNDLLNAGVTPAEISAAESELPLGMSPDDVSAAGCNAQALERERLLGVSADLIKKYAHCTAKQLLAAGFSPADLARAGFSPAEISAAGQLANNTPSGSASPNKYNCSVASLTAARAAGISAKTITETLGCPLAALKAAGFTPLELKNAGFSAAELKHAGFDAAQLKAAGFTPAELKASGFDAAQLKAAGFSPEDLLNAGFTPKELKDAGFSAAELKNAGVTAAQLKDAGFSPEELRKAGFSAAALKKAGFNAQELQKAGYTGGELQDAGFNPEDAALAGIDKLSQPVPSNIATIPSIAATNKGPTSAAQEENAKRLQDILKQQQRQQAEIRYQQKIQQRSAVMLSIANQDLQVWKTSAVQRYVAGSNKHSAGMDPSMGSDHYGTTAIATKAHSSSNDAIIKTGDILFAVIDTSINSDEQGPILATIVSGKLKGSKLIGSFNLPANADKMVISFNTLSVPDAPSTVSIAAYAIDPNTARTALASEANHHYLSRYGSLFASTFLEGFGNAFQSANTTITVGGTGGTSNTTVSNGVGRSALENAVIGLATLGKAWGQVAQQNMSRPTTVEVYSGTGVGVLFTQDVKTI